MRCRCPPGTAKYVAPIGVDIKHPMLQCEPLPCFNQQTTLDLKKTGPGAFRLINIDGSHGGTNPRPSRTGCSTATAAYMPLGLVLLGPGRQVQLVVHAGRPDRRIGSVLLFPVYRGTRGQGANFEYEIVGWVGFHMTGFDATGG